MTTYLPEDEEFRIIAETVPLGAAVIDPSQKILYANPAFERIFDYPFQGLPLVSAWLERSFLDEDSRTRVLSALEEPCCASETRDGVDCRVTACLPNGIRRDLRLKVVERSNGRRLMFVEDLSALSKLLKDKRESEEKYTDLLVHLTDFVCTLDSQGKLLTVNNAALKAFGYEAEEVLGQSIEKLIPQTLRNRIPDHLSKTTGEGSTAGMSTCLTKDGKTRHVEYRAAMIRSEGTTPRIVVAARDVSDRIRMKRALKEFEVRFKLLVENAHDGIIYVDPGGIILFTNPRMREILKDPQP